MRDASDAKGRRVSLLVFRRQEVAELEEMLPLPPKYKEDHEDEKRLISATVMLHGGFCQKTAMIEGNGRRGSCSTYEAIEIHVMKQY